MDDVDWNLLDHQVLRVVLLTLQGSIAHNVIKDMWSANIMAALSGMQEEPSTNNKVHLINILFNLNMRDNTFVAQHWNDVNTMTNQLSYIEIEFDDEMCPVILLGSLPNS